jgi:hypothetical protein
MRVIRSLAMLGFALASAVTANADEIDWKKVDATLGIAGSLRPGEVRFYAIPRFDLRLTVDGVAVKPAAFGGYIAFTPAHNGTMMMGDLVLTDTEVNPVMTKLLEGGVEISALHNHFLRASPTIWFMHIGGHGDPVQMVGALRNALSLSNTPFEPPVAAAGPSSGMDLDTATIDAAMGARGQAFAGIYQVRVPRRDPITHAGVPVPQAMAWGNIVQFQPTGAGRAAVMGDFVVSGNEVNPLIRALRASGIEVTAIHSHMLTEEPRIFYVHFWANDDATKLAQGLRAALEKTAIAVNPN